MAHFGATFGKFGLLFIPTSGHTLCIKWNHSYILDELQIEMDKPLPTGDLIKVHSWIIKSY